MMKERIAGALRKTLVGALTDEGLFLLVSFFFSSVLSSRVFGWYTEIIDLLSRYVLLPWGAVLCAARLTRASEKQLTAPDTLALTALYAWMLVPFFVRFGVTFNNMVTWYGYAVVYFGIYAMTREETPQRLERVLDRVCAGSAVTAMLLGCPLLYCAATVTTYTHDLGGDPFGVFEGELWAGYHYNLLGMIALCLLMLCLTGASRARRKGFKALYLIPAAVMTLTVVLTQSRTARYAMLLAFAVGVYGALQDRLRLKAAARHLAALMCAAAVLAGGYIACGALTDAAVEHYNTYRHTAAAAEEVPQQSAQTAEEPAQNAEKPAESTHTKRGAGGGTFSDRTTIWKNLFSLWAENPKHMVIGNGVGRTGSRIVEGTIHEENGSVAIHNTYLQFVADFGLVGFAIKVLFLVMMAGACVRVFFANGERRFAGGRTLCMLVVASLATGMMESQPLGAQTPMNMMLYFAFGVLAAAAQRMKAQE